MSRRPSGSSPRGDGARRARPGRLDEAASTAAKPDAGKPAAAKPTSGKLAAGPPASADPDLVLLGEFGRPHGLRGEIRLKSYTVDPAAIAGYGPLATADGRRVEIADLRPAAGTSPDILVARVVGIGDRAAAEALNRVTLYVARDKLGTPQDEDEFMAADLVGLAVHDGEGRAIGKLLSVQNYGGGDLLEIAPLAGGHSALLPFTRAFVPALDIAGGRVVADLPEGFFDPPGPRPKDEPKDEPA